MKSITYEERKSRLNNICKATNLPKWYIVSNFRGFFEALLDIAILKAIKNVWWLETIMKEKKLHSPPECLLRHSVYHNWLTMSIVNLMY